MLTVPSADVVANAAYYVAFFDPSSAELGWQEDWGGPAGVSGDTLTFLLPAFSFTSEATYAFALYAISSAAASPTPAPTHTTSSSPPPGALSANPTEVQISGLGAPDAQPVLIQEMGYTGSLTETNSCGGTTPIASFSASSGSGPSWSLVVTGDSTGTCLATIQDANGQSVTITVVVTATGFTVQSLR